eukprot:6187114-Pleurochrysis_carterae.AAC.1
MAHQKKGWRVTRHTTEEGSSKIWHTDEGSNTPWHTHNGSITPWHTNEGSSVVRTAHQGRVEQEMARP